MVLALVSGAAMLQYIYAGAACYTIFTLQSPIQSLSFVVD